MLIKDENNVYTYCYTSNGDVLEIDSAKATYKCPLRLLVKESKELPCIVNIQKLCFNENIFQVNKKWPIDTKV